MNYANTMIIGGIETVVTVLPLETVPAFDPVNPPPNTYTVPDDVQPGWVKQPEGHFTPPPEPEPKPPSVPATVTMRQARLALLGQGLLAQVNTAIAALPGVIGDAARVEWEYATEVRRDSALTASMAAALGLNDAALDALFTQAAGL